jgi:hypothetical protein
MSILRKKKGLLSAKTMKAPVNLELIFPIKDAQSASFMSFKANCLLGAGIITEAEKQWVEQRVLSVLAGDDYPFALNVCVGTLDLDLPDLSREDQR